jgi:hypothetical protein
MTEGFYLKVIHSILNAYPEEIHELVWHWDTTTTSTTTATTTTTTNNNNNNKTLQKISCGHYDVS